MNELRLLKKTLLDSPVINAGDDGSYQYFVHPITDGISEVSKELLDEVADAIMDIADLRCDKLVTVEAMGLLASLPLTLRAGIPTAVIRKRKYMLPGEVMVEQKTGYRNNQHLCINGLKPGDRIVFVDDVLSTGGTLVPVVAALKEMGVEIVDIVIVVNKNRSISDLEGQIGQKIKVLVSVDIKDGKVVILD